MNLTSNRRLWSFIGIFLVFYSVLTTNDQWKIKRESYGEIIRTCKHFVGCKIFIKNNNQIYNIEQIPLCLTTIHLELILNRKHILISKEKNEFWQIFGGNSRKENILLKYVKHISKAYTYIKHPQQVNEFYIKKNI